MKNHQNKSIGVAALSLLIFTMGLAYGRAQGFVRRPFEPGGGPRPMSPTLRARHVERNSLDKAAISALAVGNYAEEENDARRSVALGVGSGLGQELLAQALYDQGKDKEALSVYQVISDEGETSPGSELPYALLLFNSGHRAQAIAIYNRTLPFLNDGDLLRAHNKFSSNAMHLQDLATAIHIGLGTQYMSSSNWAGKLQNDKAMSQFHQALALEPNSPLANYYYGYGLKRLGRQAKAQAAFRRVVAIGQGDIREAALRELPAAMQPR